MSRLPPPILENFPHQYAEKLRFRDTDLLGHVNNSIYSTFFESGRVDFLFDPSNAMPPENRQFVIARAEINYRLELTWPGDVVIGTRVSRIGSSSFDLHQSVFRDDVCFADGISVMVMVDSTTKKSAKLDAETLALLKQYSGPQT